MNALSVLLIEDDDLDLRNAQRAFYRRGLSNLLRVAKDAGTALQMLRAGESALPMPCVVLLDQELPGMSGLEFLEKLRADPGVPLVDVYYVSGRLSGQEAERAKGLGVRACLHKDALGTDFMALFDILESQGHLAHIPPEMGHA
jgi:CheY-like chemotaxis protein